VTAPRTFRFAGVCGGCGELVRLTLEFNLNDNPDFEWVRCAGCDSITRIPFIRDREIEELEHIQRNE
jgi:hypothetical protein